MKKLPLLLLYICLVQLSHSQSTLPIFPAYPGKAPGMQYTTQSTVFRVWSPDAAAAELLLYKDGVGGDAFKILALKKGEAGNWTINLAGEWKNIFYTFRVKIKGAWSPEVSDPYAKAVGVNGRRSMVVDLKASSPAGWSTDASPKFSSRNLSTDAVIYELHLRDLSMHQSSGIQQKGKFGGLAETGSTNKAGLKTGLDHLKELGVTHIHLLPFFDFNSVDESRQDNTAYNWGYDPVHYNVPEGSYSTNPFDGITRIRELKQMIATLHKNGLRVVMDVVYNHTALGDRSAFEILAPGYYYRHKKDGSFSNATACGNETASEMPMMRRFMLESVLYWVKEYHVDGFRFDLMGVHDIETMNSISAALRKVKPDILLYGEGWTAGDSPLPDSLRALKKNAASLNGIAVFSDDIRDGIKGSVFNWKEKGFVSGNTAFTESVKFGIVASCKHPQVNYQQVNYSKKPWAIAPTNTITYCECHDNHALWDKLALANEGASIEDREQMQKLALTIVLTSQGIPFLHAGTEMLRSKKGVENSYNSGDSINAIDWDLKTKHKEFNDYIAQLVHLRKDHPCFRLTTAAEIRQLIHFDEVAPAGTIAYTINGAAVKDSWKSTWIAFNGTDKDQQLQLPAGQWRNALDKQSATKQGTMQLGKYSAAIFYRD